MINACKQKKLTLTTGLISFLLFVMLGSCNKSSHEHQQNLSKNNFKSLVFDLPAKDSIKPAEIEMYDEQKYEKYAVRKKVIHESDESLYAAGPGRKLKVSMPWLKKVLNLNGIILPSVPAKGEQQQGFFPEVTLAKDMAHTNTNPMGISYFGKVQGLKHDYVCKMIQDKTGNIWIATRGGGLCKYDGKYFTHFTEKKGFLSNEIWALMEDSKGNIWIGSNGNGVAVYEGNQENKSCATQQCKHNLSDPHDRIAHQHKVSYAFTIFNEKSGLSGNSIRSFFEDDKGRIWISTSNGLNVYDGKTFTAISSEIFTQGQNIFVTQDNHKDIWISGGSGILAKMNYDNMKLPCVVGSCKHQLSNEKELHFHIRELLKSISCYELIPNDERVSIGSIIKDTKQNIWIASDYGLVKLSHNYLNNACFTNTCQHKLYQEDDLNNHTQELSANFTILTQADGISNNYLLGVIEDSKNNIWACSYGGGAIRFDGKNFQHITTKQGLSTDEVFTILEDRSGNIWIGGRSGGMCKYSGSHLKHYLSFDKENKFVVEQIIPDSLGRLWISNTSGAICYFENDKLIELVPDKYPYTNMIYQSVFDKNGNLFQASWGTGFRKFDGKNITQTTGILGNKNMLLYGVTKDMQENLWFTAWDKGVIRFDGKTYMKISTAQGLSDNKVTCCVPDKQGNLWIGTYTGGINVIKPVNPNSPCNKQLCNHNPRNAKELNEHRQNAAYKISILPNPYEHVIPIYNLAVNRDGKIWIGTQGKGLRCIIGDKEFSLSTDHGLVDDFINAVTEDKNGDIWIGTRNGLSLLKKAKLDQFIKNNLRINASESMFRNYTYADGLLGVSTNRSAIYAGSDHKVWIGCSDRLTILDQDKINTDTVLPIVQITGLDLFNEQTDWLKLASNNQQSILQNNGVEIKDVLFSKLFRWYNVPDNPSMAYNNNFVSIRYIAAGTYKPQQMHYRYMLAGLDNNWNSTTEKTEVNYGNLAPGKYTFKIFAINADGKAGKITSYPFSIRPPWWRTWWAYIAYFTLVLSSAVIYIRWRERALRLRQKELELKVDEATSEIRNQKAVVEQEKQRSEELLLNILPGEVAEELKLNGKAEAKQMDEVTVLFTDFKGFTEISAQLNPKELVNEIHECFSAFDRIMQKHGVEKIKTIGDAYMAAGGIPIASNTHATDVVTAALELQQFMIAHKKEKEKNNELSFEIRIGVHSGPVVAGIVGVKKFAYDIWGDTVNTASRMESSGEVGKVNISGATYKYVKDYFKCTYRGKIQVKGKGEIDMYFVEADKKFEP